jgi:hypothetical protein
MLTEDIVFVLGGRLDDHPFHVGIQTGAIMEYSEMNLVTIYKLYAYFRNSGAFSSFYLAGIKAAKPA